MKKFKLDIKAAQKISTEVNKNISDSNNSFIEAKSQCNHITGNIYLSSYKKAQDLEFLKSNEITHIVNCAPLSKSFEPVYFENLQYLCLDLKDEPGYDLISVIFSFIEFLEKIDNLNEIKSENDNESNNKDKKNQKKDRKSVV